MYETVAVPIDLTEASTHAIATAVLLARAWTVPIQLVVVTSPGVDPLEATMILERLAEEIDAPVRPPLVLADNDVGRALAGYAGRDALLCMAAHGRGSVAGALLGSVTRDVLVHAVAPVLLVGPHCVPSPELTDICVAIRPGWPRSEGAVDAAIQWARRSRTRLHLVAAVGASDALVVGDDDARADVEVLARRGRDAGVPTCWRLVAGDDVATRLVAAAEDVGASLLVVASRARGGLRTLVLGSVTQEVVRRATCPVLAVPPHGTE